MSFLKRFLLLSAAAVLLGCSSQQSAEVGRTDQAGSAPVQNIADLGASGVSERTGIEIAPLGATKDSTIWVVSRGKKVEESGISWLVNGEQDEKAAGYVFKAAGVKKGDTVQASAEIDGREVPSNVIEIQDAAPEIKDVRFTMPGAADPTDRVGAEVSASDADGDDLTILYEWTNNGEPAGNEKKMNVPVKRGDRIVLKVVASDGEKKGREVVLHREVLNLLPVVSQSDDFHFDGKVWTHQVGATDPDGDELSYSLRNGPSGMVINPATGLITWLVPKEFAGRKAVTVVVKDGHGGEVTRVLNIEIRGN